MSLALNRIAKYLLDTYGSHIDLSDVKQKRSEEDLEKDRLSRSLVAHTVARLSRIDPLTAAKTVCDGFDDLGVDAFHYDREAKTAYVVQGKWSSNGGRRVSETDAIKTLGGLRSLLSLDLSSANERLKAFYDDVDEAANDSETKFCVVFATSSKDCFEPKARSYVESETVRIAGLDDLVFVEEFTVGRLYETISAATEPEKICIAVELEEWAKVAGPPLAYYGRVPLAEVLKWSRFGTDLFHRNLRSFLGDEELTASLQHTLENEPNNFWYFNNGATLLCDKLIKRPLHGDNRAKGTFDCEGASIVNGAQTIGIIWRHAGDGSNLDPDARLPLRLISLEDAPDDFSATLTRALNTQRRIDSRDFVALDPLQHRIRRDMAIDGRVYIFRAGDSPKDNTAPTCLFVDAAVALACALGDVELATQAKRYVSSLWASTSREPYTKIFPSAIDAETVWRASQISKAVLETLEELRQDASGRKKTVLSHGNRFILYRVFNHAEIKPFKSQQILLDDLLKAAHAVAKATARVVCDVMTGKWRDETVQYVFKYASKCRELDKLCDLAIEGSPDTIERQTTFLDS